MDWKYTSLKMLFSIRIFDRDARRSGPTIYFEGLQCLLRLEQIGSDRIKLDQLGSSLIKLDQG